MTPCDKLEFCIGIDTVHERLHPGDLRHLPAHRHRRRARRHGVHALRALHGDRRLHAQGHRLRRPAFRHGAAPYRLGKYLHPERFAQVGQRARARGGVPSGRAREHGEILRRACRKCVVAQVPIEYYKYEKGLLRPDGQPGFATPTGRVELWSTALQPVRRRPAAVLPGARVQPGQQAGARTNEYPLILTTGRTHHGVLPFGAPPDALPARAQPRSACCEINPETAKRHGVADGQWVRMWNMFGECVHEGQGVRDRGREDRARAARLVVPRRGRQRAQPLRQLPLATSTTCSPTATWASWASARRTSA